MQILFVCERHRWMVCETQSYVCPFRGLGLRHYSDFWKRLFVTNIEKCFPGARRIQKHIHLATAQGTSPAAPHRDFPLLMKYFPLCGTSRRLTPSANGGFQRNNTRRPHGGVSNSLQILKTERLEFQRFRPFGLCHRVGLHLWVAQISWRAIPFSCWSDVVMIYLTVTPVEHRQKFRSKEYSENDIGFTAGVQNCTKVMTVVR